MAVGGEAAIREAAILVSEQPIVRRLGRLRRLNSLSTRHRISSYLVVRLAKSVTHMFSIFDLRTDNWTLDQLSVVIEPGSKMGELGQKRGQSFDANTKNVLTAGLFRFGCENLRRFGKFAGLFDL